VEPVVEAQQRFLMMSWVSMVSLNSVQHCLRESSLSRRAAVHTVTTLADTGIRVGLKGNLDADSVDTLFIESSWTDMQTCLGVVATSPFVIVSADAIEPLSNADDVLFHIDGSITATSTLFASGVTIQVSNHDLDGSLSRTGFNLRSIIGRYLWLSANLPEREYDHTCASQG